MFADQEIIRASQNFVRLIIRRPHAYWFKQRFPETPIPGLVVLSSEGKVLETFSLLAPGPNTLGELRTFLKAPRKGVPAEDTKPAKSPRNQKRATFHILGMKKTASGAT